MPGGSQWPGDAPASHPRQARRRRTGLRAHAQARSCAPAWVRYRVCRSGRSGVRRDRRHRHHRRIPRVTGRAGRAADRCGQARWLHRRVPDADHGGAGRPPAVAGDLGRAGPAHQLAPAGRAVGVRPHRRPCGPDHARLCPGRAGRGAAPAVGVRHVLSGPAGGDRRLRSPGDGRAHLVRLARRRLKYETWWVVHLYVYLGLALAFAHQIVTGVPFIGHPLTRAVWIVVWACTAGMVIVFRVAPADLAERPASAAGRRGPGQGAGRGLGHLPGPAARSAGGVGRPVLPVALPHQGPVVAGAPVFAVGAAATPVPPGDDQGARGPEWRGAQAPAGHPRGHRGTLRGIHPPCAYL